MAVKYFEDIDEANDWISDNEPKISALEENVKKLEEELTEKNKLVAKLSKEKREELAEEKKPSLSFNEESEKLLKEKLEAEKKLKREITELKNKYSKDLVTLTNERDNARKERDARPNITLVDYTQQTKNAATALAAMEGERDARAKITPADLLNLQNELATKTTFIDPAELETVQNELQKLKDSNLNWKNQVDDLNTKNAKLLNDLTAANKKITDLQKLSNTAQESFNKQQEELNNANKTITEEAEKQKVLVNDFNKQLISTKDEIERLKTQLTTSQEEEQKLKGAIANDYVLKVDVASLQQKLIALQTKINELESEVAAANAAKADAEETTRLANQDKDTAENELTNLKHDLATNYFKRADLEREAANAGWQFTQADLDKAKAEAKQGLFTQEQLNAAKSGATVDPNTYILKTDTPALKAAGIDNGLVDPINYFLKTDLPTEAKKLGLKWTDLDLANAENNAKKNLVDPTDEEAITKANLVRKSIYDNDLTTANETKDQAEKDLAKMQRERDARPNITLAELKNLHDQLNAKNNFVDPKDLDQLKTTLTQELGIDFHSSDWHTSLINKLGGKTLAEIPNSQTLKNLLENDPGNSTERIKNLEEEIAKLTFTLEATIDQIILEVGNGTWRKHNNNVEEFVKAWERKRKAGEEYKPKFSAYIEQKKIGQ